MASGSETSIERLVREQLESAGVIHQQQVQIGPWVVDFLVFDLVIEADGSYWHTLRPDVDRRKTADLKDRGYKVWRLSEHEIRAPDFSHHFAKRMRRAARG